MALLEAGKLRLRIMQGEDPGEDRRKAVRARYEAAKAAQARLTCREALVVYHEVLLGRGLSLRHVADELGQSRRAIDSVGLLDKPVGNISVAAVEKILAQCPRKSRPARFGALDRFLRWGLRHGGEDAVAPTARLTRYERPKPLPPRERVLSAVELGAIWHAMEQHISGKVRDLVLFLVTTPARESEVAKMRWRDVDLPGATWTQPTSKNGKSHRYPLNQRAIEILQRRHWAMDPGAHGKNRGEMLVFPGPVCGNVFRAWSKVKLALDKRSGVTGWRLHDLRRSFVTHMNDAGFDYMLADLCINHSASRTRNPVTRAYNLSERWPDRVRLMEEWSRYLDAAVVGASVTDANLVILPTRRASRAAVAIGRGPATHAT
jgi:integrase